jgi:cell division protein FtsW
MVAPPRETDAPKGGFFTRIQLGPALQSDSGGSVLVLGSTLLLVFVGLVMVLSSSSIVSYLDNQGFFGGFWKQATYAVVGIPLMLIAGRLPLIFWKRWAWAALILGLFLQLLVFTPLGIESYGNRNWVAIGGISGQPSEFLKLALIVWMAAVLFAKRDLIQQTKHALIPVVPVAGLAIALVLAGSDLGTVLVMSLIVMSALYFAGVTWRAMSIPLILGLVMVFVMAIISPNRMSRITAFFEPECTDYSGLCWQPLHGLWALAGGGVFGLGLGNSRAKWSWLPAADNDYIFAIIGEELGMIGAVVVILIFVVLAFGILNVMRKARDLFGVIVTGSIFVWIIGQAFINIGVVVGLLPVLGVPLPFVSSGGTALISNLLAIGVVLSIARDAQKNPDTSTQPSAANIGRRLR